MSDLIRKFVVSEYLLPCLEIKKDSLHSMIRQSQMEVLKMLLTSVEVDVNFKDYCGDTPLHVATRTNNVEAVRLLFSRKVDITSRNDLGVTPVLIAFEEQNEKVLTALLEKGKQCFGYHGRTFRMYQIVCKLIIKGYNEELLQLFSENKDIDIDFKALIGVESPLMLAVAGGNFKVVETLLKCGANVNYRKDGFGMSALHVAVRNHKVEMIDLLLEYNADVNCYLSNSSLITPLHYAIKAPGRISTKMLLEKGASANFLSKDKAYTSALHWAAVADDVTKCELLINSGANIDFVNEIGHTPLLSACKNNSFNVVNLLLENKANPNIADSEGNTPLFWLCKTWIIQSKPLELAKKLIYHGADTDAQNNHGITILHLAYENVFAIAEFLLEEGLGPDINCIDKFGRTPLAPEEESHDCKDFMLLLRHGGDINISVNPRKVNLLMPYTYTEIADNDKPFNNLNCPVYAHFEKLKLLGYNVNKILWSKYQKSVCSIHSFDDSDITVADFHIELKKLKTTIIGYNPKKTLYDILFMKQDLITTYCCNNEYENLYKQNNNNFENMFLHYGWLLNLQYRRGQQRRQLMHSAVEVLRIASGSNVLSLWTFILKYLTNADLRLILRYEHK